MINPFPSAKKVSKERQGKPKGSCFDKEDSNSISTLIHKIGHEIGNPLTAIISLATVSKRVSSNLEPETAERIQGYSESITSEAWKINSLTQKLVLLLSRNPPNSSAVEIEQIARSTLQRLHHQIPKPYQKTLAQITSQLSFDSSLRILIDKEQFAHLLSELITNAIAAIHRGLENETWLEPLEIMVSLKYLNNNIVLEVENPCAEPCPFEIEDLFHPFVCSINQGGHLGIGLPMAAAVVERMNGQINIVEKTTNGKTRFLVQVTIPAALAEEEGPLKATKTPDVNFQLPSTLKVLIVEDEPNVASAMEKILQAAFSSKTSLEVTMARGKDVFDKLATGKGKCHDVILCDLNLQDIGGQDVYDYLSEKDPQTLCRLAFLSGDRSSLDTAMYLDTSGRPYLYKPFEANDLVELVKKTLQLAKKP